MKYSQIFAIQWSPMIGPPADNSDPNKTDLIQTNHVQNKKPAFPNLDDLKVK